ncbi:hypothetical protein N7493_007366 [Penicillium malachiteum]|uniref:Apple domain-containing protein n=1 Tax=Penicillium malachiteum TaxID=1324776 RepID=A0AAD6HJY0_9EURO|nr:hypothetical protein N7493_007366 [Penicillium malachiteum]
MKLNLLGLSLAIFGLSLAETLSTKDHFNRLCGSSSSYHGKVTNINGHDFKVFCNQAISASDATRIDGVVTPEQCGQICTISKCLDSLWSDSGHCWLKEAKSTPYTTSSTTTFLVLQRVNTVEECKADLETCKAKGPGDNDDDSELEDPFLKPSEGNCESEIQ